MIFLYLSACEWTDGKTKLQLDYYECHLHELGPMKRFKNYNRLFLQISNDLNEAIGSTKTADQCKNHYKIILKRKRKAVCHDNQPGAARCAVPFEEEMERIRTLHDSIEPEAQRDILGAKFKESSNPPISSSSSLEPTDTSGISPENTEPDASIPSTADRALRASTARMKDMKFLFEETKNTEVKRQKRRQERGEQRAQREMEKENAKEKRREEQRQMHNEKVILLRWLLADPNENE